MDPLTDVLSLLRPHAAFSKPITGRGKWGVRYEAQDSPGFCVVLEGRCWLTTDGDPPRLLERGDFVLLTSTPAFLLASELGAECAPSRPSRNGVRHGDPKGPPDFRMIGGTFGIDRSNAGLLRWMSRTIHIRAAEFDTTRLTRIIDLIMDEYSADRPGRDAILQRFLEAMLVEALRAPGFDREPTPPGLIAGLRDAHISRSLRAIHSDVCRGWTVAELAKRAGMSRSAFASRFVAAVGCAPIEYLSKWRMSLAQDALTRGGKSIDDVAEEIGYESASAFSTAFRRIVGCPPGAFSRMSQRG